MSGKGSPLIKTMCPANRLIRLLKESQLDLKQYRGYVLAQFDCVCRDGKFCVCHLRPTRPPATAAGIAQAKARIAELTAGIAAAEAELEAGAAERQRAAEAAAEAAKVAAAAELVEAEARLAELRGEVPPGPEVGPAVDPAGDATAEAVEEKGRRGKKGRG